MTPEIAGIVAMFGVLAIGLVMAFMVVLRT
jgi:hypothetical protein